MLAVALLSRTALRKTLFERSLPAHCRVSVLAVPRRMRDDDRGT